jgi:hypothetical protein
VYYEEEPEQPVDKQQVLRELLRKAHAAEVCGVVWRCVFHCISFVDVDVHAAGAVQILSASAQQMLRMPAVPPTAKEASHDLH